jgi:hypothetical protein
MSETSNDQDAKGAKSRQEPDESLDRLAHDVIRAAIEVHRELGPGFLEVVYRRSLAILLREQGIEVVEEEPMDVFFRGQ